MILHPVPAEDSTRTTMFGRTARTIIARGMIADGGPRTVPTVKAPEPECDYCELPVSECECECPHCYRPVAYCYCP